jgi:hypothetical protein
LLSNQHYCAADSENGSETEPGLNQISCEEFIEHIRPSVLIFYGDGSGIWCYDDGQLFVGDSIEVSFDQDKNFDETVLMG